MPTMAPKDIEYIKLAHQRAAEKKTHVSFPQLKYPSLRDGGFRDAVQWLTGKAMDDGVEGLWRVHNGIYDFTDFVDRHPGGAEWLELSKGTDITEAFECHHNNPVVDKMLEKYLVKEVTTPRNSPFSFKEDGFYRSLKRAVREELKKIPPGGRTAADNITDGLFVTLLVSSVLSCWFKDYWAVMISYVVASLSLAWMTVASHNYIHRKTNWRMYLWNFSLWSYRDFRVSHALSHHLYPNTLMDLEVSAFEPLVFWNPRKKPIYAWLTFPIEFIVFPTLFIQNFMKRFLSNFLRKGFFTRHYRWHDAVGFLLPVWMYFISGVTFYEAFIMWLWINCTASAIFYHIGSNAAHHHPKIFKDGDQVSDPNPDWGIHEVETLMERKEINSNIFTVMTFFGDHTLHHLFPVLDHSVLPKLYPVFLEHCQRFKGNFRVTNSLDLFIGQLKMSLKTDPTTLDEKKNL